jgi:membrane dipeptidase
MNKIVGWLTAAALASAVLAAPVLAQNQDYAKRIDRVLARTPLIDGHNDLPWEIRERFNNDVTAVDLSADTAHLPLKPGEAALMTDIPRMRAGRMGAQFWSVWIPVTTVGSEAVQVTLEQIDLVKRIAARYPKDLEMAYTAADIRRIHKSGKIASLVGIEGGHQINDSLAMLRQMYDAGARYMTLTHSSNTAWADSATDDPAHPSRAGNESHGNVGRPQSCLRRHDARRTRGERSAGHLFAFIRARRG